VVQALSIFIAACITITVFTGSGRTDGRSKWFFATCWLSIPALIYLVAVPIWSRAANVAKALWFAVVDLVFTIFWLSAFAAVLAWLRAGMIQGTVDKKIPQNQGNCTTFAYGTEKQCTLSYAASGFGVFIFLLFAATSTISVLYVLKAKKNPQADDPWLAPGSSQSYVPTAGGDIERGGSVSKDPIWDANTRDLEGHEQDSDDERGASPNHGDDDDDDDYQHDRHRTDPDAHPGRPVHWEPLGAGNVAPPFDDTEYRGATTYQPPSAMSPTSIHSPSAGEYGRGRQGGNYSFR